VSEIRFRAATRADDAFFRQVEFDTTWASLDPEDRERLGPREVREALDLTHELLLERPGNRIVIAEDEEGVRIGLLWFGVNRNLITGEEEAWVYNVSVLPEYRGRGLGRRLMEHAEELARAGGFHVLGLMVSAHNDPARGLYEKLAFRASNLVMRKRL
jgi:ribosomal protein S18 acetylase RimI-like enzyme